MADKLQAKIFISGEIHLKTGLHIGTSSSSMELGGLENGIIKTAKGVPYIPGSTLKGKLRNMLAKYNGFDDVKNDNEPMRKLFGSAVSDHKNNSGQDQKAFPARLITRDAYLDKNHFESVFDGLEMETDYSEVKYENNIRRKDLHANPRHNERVPAGAIFIFNMVLDDYGDAERKTMETQLKLAMQLLEGDYIGGSGTRGYGQIKFEKIVAKRQSIINGVLADDDTYKFDITT